MEITVPDLALVALIGASGAGKSTFAARHFRPTQVLSSDWFRAMVRDDPEDMSANADAFEALYDIAARRLRAGLLTVVDATSVQRADRAKLLAVAKAHDVLATAIVLDPPAADCLAHNAARPDRTLDPHVIHRQRDALRRGLRGLPKEGFRKVHVLSSVEEIDTATIAYEKQYNDKRELTGPFDLIGDVHGCRSELVTLLRTLGYEVHADGARHPAGRTAVFLGDLVDRGPDSPGVLRLVMGMVAAGDALAVPGNHEQKLVRALDGRSVTRSHGLQESLDQLAAVGDDFRRRARDFMHGLVSHYVLDGGRLVVAHAGLTEAYQGRSSGRVRAFCLYGDTTGETDEYGLPVRYPWAEDYRGRAAVVYGHTPTPEAKWVNGTICLDTGCVFGGKLTALRWPERELVSVPAERVWYEPAKPLGGPVRAADQLALEDVAGDRVVLTGHAGAVKVRADNAAAALEVMSRWAIDPRLLVHLPPTMSPTTTSDLDGLLEHPAEAFAAYLADGVDRVVCEEKHMGSRAIVLVCRTTADRFGVPDASGAVHTRTGRSFFSPALTEELLARVRAGVEAAGLWEELDTDWLLLDCELLPWSAKAGDLLRRQYAPVAAAGSSALPAALSALETAAARGRDVGGLLARTEARAGNLAAYTAAYTRYCWPTDGLAGVTLAPFTVLAYEGAVAAVRDRAYHLGLADRLVAADPGLFTPTRRLFVDTASPAAAIDWWTSLVEAGGEGMVVKPAAGLVRGRKGLAQPGIKCRGPEYLRIIYGPDYTAPEHLARLRGRQVGKKRSLAVREYALGVEALTRLVAGEPTWRVHEPVFAVLALESEPVDPRL